MTKFTAEIDASDMTTQELVKVIAMCCSRFSSNLGAKPAAWSTEVANDKIVICVEEIDLAELRRAAS